MSSSEPKKLKPLDKITILKSHMISKIIFSRIWKVASLNNEYSRRRWIFCSRGKSGRPTIGGWALPAVMPRGCAPCQSRWTIVSNMTISNDVKVDNDYNNENSENATWATMCAKLRGQAAHSPERRPLWSSASLVSALWWWWQWWWQWWSWWWSWCSWWWSCTSSALKQY